MISSWRSSKSWYARPRNARNPALRDPILTRTIALVQIPKTNEFPGPRSVFVLDNWPGHVRKDFVDLCVDNKIAIEYNVPYAPHIMVHEKCGRTAKDEMRKRGREWTEQGFDSRQTTRSADVNTTSAGSTSLTALQSGHGRPRSASGGCAGVHRHAEPSPPQRAQ